MHAKKTFPNCGVNRRNYGANLRHYGVNPLTVFHMGFERLEIRSWLKVRDE